MELLGAPGRLYKDRRCWDSIDPNDDPHLLHNNASSCHTEPNKTTRVMIHTEGFITTLKTGRNGPLMEEHNKIANFLCLHSGILQDWDTLVLMTVRGCERKSGQSSADVPMQCSYLWINVAQGDCPTRSTRHPWRTHGWLWENDGLRVSRWQPPTWRCSGMLVMV